MRAWSRAGALAGPPCSSLREGRAERWLAPGGLDRARRAAMFVAAYWGRVHPGKEEQFRKA